MDAAVVTKKEASGNHPAKDYAYVPDASVSSSWKLLLTGTTGGPPDAGHVGAAVAALGKGFRGNRVEIPASDLPAVKRKVRGAWGRANPDKTTEEMPEVLKASADLLAPGAIHTPAYQATAPPGWGKTVEEWKRDKQVDNPFALAWWLEQRGVKPTSAAYHAEAAACLHSAQLSGYPRVAVAAAHGEAWAQAQILTPEATSMVYEERAW